LITTESASVLVSNSGKDDLLNNYCFGFIFIVVGD